MRFCVSVYFLKKSQPKVRPAPGKASLMRLREFRGLAPKTFFLGGLAPQNHLTMVITPPPPLPSASSSLPSLINKKTI